MDEGSSGYAKPRSSRMAIVLGTFILSICLIAGSFAYTDVRRDSYDESMGPYDAAVDLVEQVNDNRYLRAVGVDGKEYGYVILSKASLEWYSVNPGAFAENITSRYHYRMTFDDVDIPDSMHYPALNLSSYYVFGETPPDGRDTVRLTVQYTLHLFTPQPPVRWADEFRHVCHMTVEVWE